MKDISSKFLILLIFLVSGCEKNGPEDPDENPANEIIFQTFDYPSGTIKMIYCPGGTFLSNEDDGDQDFEDEFHPIGK